MGPLVDRVALVTGAIRGVGKGVVVALGEARATVYVTGRTESAEAAAVPLSGMIHQTTAMVSEAGGKGIAIRCDHSNDEQVRQVFERIGANKRRLDILVNTAWGGYKPSSGAGSVTLRPSSGRGHRPSGTRCSTWEYARATWRASSRRRSWCGSGPA